MTERATRAEFRLGGELQELSRLRAKRTELLRLQDRLAKEPDVVKDVSLVQRMRELSTHLDGTSDASRSLVRQPRGR